MKTLAHLWGRAKCACLGLHTLGPEATETDQAGRAMRVRECAYCEHRVWLGEVPPAKTVTRWTLTRPMLSDEEVAAIIPCHPDAERISARLVRQAAPYAGTVADQLADTRKRRSRFSQADRDAMQAATRVRTVRGFGPLEPDGVFADLQSERSPRRDRYWPSIHGPEEEV